MLRVILALLALALPAHGQVWIMAPQSLVKKFEKSNGSIIGATATFGAPFYGQRVLGQVIYPASKQNNGLCNSHDYDLPPETNSVRKNGEEKDIKLIKILLVRRSAECPITKKVRVAKEKGAHAVIVVDKEDSNFSSEDMPHVIVRNSGEEDDGSLIPSILISKTDGKLLIDAARAAPTVVVELKWNVPVNYVVNADLWMSSASKESLQFLRDFAAKRKVLNKVVAFHPHYSIFSMDATDSYTRHDNCFKNDPKYCTEDPDGTGPVKGVDVVTENVRQLCIHKKYKQPQTIVRETGDVVHYAEKYWQYVEKFQDRCLPHFGETCSTELMKEVKIEPTEIANCVDRNGTAFLSEELEHRAWSPRALRINGWRYSGEMSADLVTRAICSGFIELPRECELLVEKRDPFNPYVPQEKRQGVSTGTVFMWLLGTGILVFFVLVLYRRYLHKDLRAQLREEVMLEVQSAFGSYKQMASG